MPNPMINPGVLNRVRGSIKYTDFPELNISASYLTREGIELSPQGDLVESLPCMTGVAQSSQPYMELFVRIHLVRSQALANIYKQQWEKNSLVGNIRAYTDSSKFGDFDLVNVSIRNVDDISIAGTDPSVIVTLSGTYYINSEMWDAV